jgi:dihydrofolate reductase
MPRPRTAAYLAMSLDGYIARPDGKLDWLDRMHVPDVDYGFAAFFAGIDTLLVGRATWEVVLGFPEWPYAGKRVAVLTRRPAEPQQGELVLAGPPADVLRRLEEAGARSVYVDGGAVVSQFLAAGLLDELTVSVVPVVLGAGIRLFQGAGPERWLTLRETRAWPSGLVRLEYGFGP